MEQGGEQCDTVHHCDVDHLALPRGRPLEQRPEDAYRQQHAATAEVTDQVERGSRGLPGSASERIEGAGERHVVEVVAGRRRVRPALTPSGDAGEDEPGVAAETDVRTDAEPFGDAGPERVDQDVGPIDETEQRVGAVRVLEVDPHRGTTPCEQVDPSVAVQHPLGVRSVVVCGRVVLSRHLKDIGTEVGEQHGPERARAPPLELDDPEAGEWSAGGGR